MPLNLGGNADAVLATYGPSKVLIVEFNTPSTRNRKRSNASSPAFRNSGNWANQRRLRIVASETIRFSSLTRLTNRQPSN
jgi:hypothetical protein